MRENLVVFRENQVTSTKVFRSAIGTNRTACTGDVPWLLSQQARAPLPHMAITYSRTALKWTPDYTIFPL